MSRLLALLVCTLSLSCQAPTSTDCGAADETDLGTAAKGEMPRPTALVELISTTIKAVNVSALIESVSPKKVTSKDPYYKTQKTFWALPAGELLQKQLKLSPDSLRQAHFLLIAKDGYRVRISGKKLADPDAHFAFADTETDGFFPIGERKADPAPLYLIWAGEEKSDEKKYPRPWAISRIEIEKDTAALSRIRPPSGLKKGSPSALGLQLFIQSCIRCHSINQEGGKLGPDLNVPQNILSYRPEAQVRAYIKKPETFRYSTMPAHEYLSDDEVDGLISYLRLMAENQIEGHRQEVSP